MHLPGELNGVDVRGGEPGVECNGLIECSQGVCTRDAVPEPVVDPRLSQLKPHARVFWVAPNRLLERGEQPSTLRPPRRVVREPAERLEQ